MNILLIEDDQAIARYICNGLTQTGKTVEWAANGKIGLSLALEQEFEVCIVDRLLPGLDGLSVVKGLRAIGNSTPVLFLSALSDVDERVKGLTAGGDDYLVKPFAFSELEARVNILANRRKQSVGTNSHIVLLGDIELNLITRKLTINRNIIDLKAKEFALIEKLLCNPGRVYSRTMLMEQVWGYHFETHTNVIDVHVSNLRKKIDSVSNHCYIKTVRGAGYAMELRT